MNATHTPGPLHKVRFLRDHNGVALTGFQVSASDGTIIAEAYPRPWPVAVNEDNARLLAAAYTSYDKHCGPRAIEAAEGDLLGEALEVIRAAIAVHGTRYSWGAKADAVLAKAGAA